MQSRSLSAPEPVSQPFHYSLWKERKQRHAPAFETTNTARTVDRFAARFAPWRLLILVPGLSQQRNVIRTH